MRHLSYSLLFLSLTMGSCSGQRSAVEVFSSPDDAPSHRFIQVNDLHVEDPGAPTTGYDCATSRALWLVQAINDGQKFGHLDLVVMTGDLVLGKEKSRIERNLKYFKENIVEKLKVPVLLVIGNHENNYQERDLEWEEPFRRYFPKAASLDRVVQLGDLAFVVLNNTGTSKAGPKVLEDRRNGLESLIRSCPDQDKILLSHIPLLSLRDREVLHRSFGPASFESDDAQLLQIIEKPEHRFLAALSGHTHLTGRVLRHGVSYSSVSGTASFPHDVGVFDVYADRIEVRVVGLPHAFWRKSTNIHGSHRHGEEITDSEHSDHRSYIAGNPDERRFTIPRSLQKDQRPNAQTKE